MDRFKKYRKEMVSPHLVDLPEQILRQILHYLDFETLYFGVNEVCQLTKKLVNQYIEMGGVFLLIGTSSSSSPLDLVYIFRQSSKRFNVRWKRISPVSCDVAKEHPGSLCGPLCPPFYPGLDNELNYFAWCHTILACVFQRQRYVIYQYRFATDQWNIIYSNVSPCECKDRVLPSQHSHPVKLLEGATGPLTFLHKNIKETTPYMEIKSRKDSGLIYEAKFCDTREVCIVRLAEMDSFFNYASVCVDPKRIYIVGGFSRSQKGSKRNKNAKIPRAYIDKYQLNGKIHCFNKTIFLAELSSDRFSIIWRSKYLDDMPFRDIPLCFKLKNNMYIAGNLSGTQSLQREDTEISSCNHNSNSVSCICCDRFDFSNEKYYRNVYSIPYTLSRVFRPKVIKDENESFAVIAFYDLLDCQEKIWTFTEDSGFEEDFDPRARLPCKLCTKSKKHQSHSSSKRQILRIK